MEAIINKIQLKKIFNRSYLEIILTDIDGNLRKIKLPFSNNPTNFRKQIFGILCACNTFDLLKLATKDSNPKEAIGYYVNGLKILENAKSEWLYYDKNRGEYTCKNANKYQKKVLNSLIENNMSNISIMKGQIEKIESQSGVFQILFNSLDGATFFTTGQIYYGLEYPINVGNKMNTNDINDSARLFTSFILSIMKWYGVNDLLDFGRKKDNLPIVNIDVNINDEVDSITNIETGRGLSLGKEYEIVSLSEKEKCKVKSYN